MYFKKDTEVEVTSDIDGFRGAWYLAKIIQAPDESDDHNDCFVVVEYNEFICDEDESKKLSERVHVSFVRPLPPPMVDDDSVELNDVVDVFYKDGWWVGVVEEVVCKDEFVVCFDNPPDKMVVKRLDVRLHFDWVNGKWEKPKEKSKNKKMDSSRLAMLSDHPGNSKTQDISAKKQQLRKSCASPEKKDTGMHDEIVEKECNVEEVDVSARIRETPRKKEQKNKNMDQDMHTVDDSSRPAMLSGYSRRHKARAEKQHAGKSCASTEKKATGMNDEIVEKECNAKEVDMAVEELKGVPAKNYETRPKKVQKNKILDQEMHTVDSKTGSFKRQRSRVKKQQDKKGCVSIEKKDNTGVHVDILEKKCITEVVKGALSAKDCETSLKKDQKKQSTDQEITTVDNTNGSTQGDVSLKRKRGEHIGKGSTGAKRSLQEKIMEDSCAGNEAETNAESDYLMQTTLDDKSNENHFQPSKNDSMKVTVDKKDTNGVHRHINLLSETAIIPLPKDQAGETVPSKTGRRLKNSVSNEHEGMSKLADKCRKASQINISLPEIHHEKDIDMVIYGILDDVNADQVSNSSVQVDKPSPTSLDSSRTSPVQRQCGANANGRQDDFGPPEVAKKDRTDNTDGLKSSAPGDLLVNNLNQADKNGEIGTAAGISIDNKENGQSLPFIKRSPLWKAIESMEIYKRMEQKPHFSPLVKCYEETREGLAIAHMVTFSNLIEKTAKLQFSHPITVIESNLETLADLESYGFDVETIRACLTQLLSKKQMGERLQKEYQDIENKISNSFNEKKNVDEEITQLKQKIDELAAKLDDAVSRKEMEEGVISTLKLRQDVVSKNVQGLQLDFQDIPGSLC